MPKVSKATAAEEFLMRGYEGAVQNFPGGWTVAFEEYSEDLDLAPLFVGLPNDQCQSIHMGYVLKGRLGYRTAHGEEFYEAGEAYFVGPGHTPIMTAGTEVVEFSPTEELVETLEVVGRNLEAAGE